MKTYKLKNGTHEVTAVRYDMGSLEGYKVQYKPDCNWVWCERTGFERDYEPCS